MKWTEQPIFFVDFEGSRASGILEFGVVEVHCYGPTPSDVLLVRRLPERRARIVGMGAQTIEIAGEGGSDLRDHAVNQSTIV